MNHSGNYAAIRNIPLFNQYSENELHFLAMNSNVKKYRKNTIVIMEDDDSKSVFFILEGAVRVFHEDERGREITLNDLKVGDFFGELALISSRKRNASVITKQSAKLLIMQAGDFEKFYFDHPELAHAISIKYAHMISSLSKQLEAVALKEMQSRVIWAIKSQEIGNNGEAATLTHRDIANLIGSSRESVSRAINDLKKSGNLKQTKNSIQLVGS